jgi:hypothetical protein
LGFFVTTHDRLCPTARHLFLTADEVLDGCSLSSPHVHNLRLASIFSAASSYLSNTSSHSLSNSFFAGLTDGFYFISLEAVLYP